MLLEFNVYELKKESKYYKQLVEDYNEPNEFIIIGEELVNKDYDCYKAHQLQRKGLCLLGGLSLDETAYHIKKEDLHLKGDGISNEVTELDIPKKYLTIDVIDNIQRLNH